MDPEETRKNYDDIACWWLEQMKGSAYGMAALERALKFVGTGRHALDVGCGCEGRFFRMLQQHKFSCSGMDISSAMIEIAAQRFPDVEFFVADVCSWQLPRTYDLISAWDSVFHLPLECQERVLVKLCAGLAGNGVLLFSCGGGEEPGMVDGEFGGKRFGYSTLGVPAFLKILRRSGCRLGHLEYDQYPENHVYIIAQKIEGGDGTSH